MNNMKRIITLITLTLLTATAACANETPQRRPFLEYWLAIYNGVQQIGCMQTTLSCDTLKGEEVFKRQDNIFIRAKDSDTTYRITINGATYATKRFTPITDGYTLDASSVTSGKTEEQHVTVEFDYINKTQKTVYKSGNETKEETVHADLDASAQDILPEFCTRPLKPGDKLTCSTIKFPSATTHGGQFMFYRSTSEIRVLRREKIETVGKTYNALVLQDKSNYGVSTRWQLDNGVIIKEDIPYSGMTLQAIAEKDARDWIDKDGLDLVNSLERIECDNKIAYSTSVMELGAKLVGVRDKSLISNDNRQKVKYDPRTKAAEYSITASSFDPSRSISLPITDPGMRKWLQQADGLEINDDTIKKLAREIVADEKNAYIAATKIRQWVHKNIQYVKDSKTPNSALAILKEKQGVCAHMAILYTTLARAAGIPTYLVVGPEYWGDCFLWHAWAESYVGEWVPLDPTLDTDFVDATHIKMFTGNGEVMSNYGVARGQLRAEVMSFKHDTIIRSDTKLYWYGKANGADLGLQQEMDEVFMFRPNGQFVSARTNIADLITKEFGVTKGIRFQIPDGETIILPQESKILPSGSTCTGSFNLTEDSTDRTVYVTLQSTDCTVIRTSNGTTIVLPPESKLLQQ